MSGNVYSMETGAKIEEFTEDMVTDEGRLNSHCPSQLIPSIQLPSLVTSETEKLSHNGTDYARWNRIMAAGERLVCDRNDIKWLNKKLYIFFNVLLAHYTGSFIGST